jgi:hypothetical protein
MLVVTSNWAIGDGSLVRGSRGWQGMLPATIHRAALRAGFRRDGTYHAIDGIDLVLAGDTFDWLVSAEWRGSARPWHGTVAARTAADRVAGRSVRAARAVLGPLVRWSRRGLAVPASGPRGRPGRESVIVPVRLTLLAGDRDAALADVAGRGGRRSFGIGDAWDDGKLSIRHGHDLDPTCSATGRPRGSAGRAPTLAESVAVDLVAAFAEVVARQESPTVMPLLRAVAAAGPVAIPGAIAGWTATVARDAGFSAAAIEPLASAWRRCVDRWLAAAQRDVPSCEVEFDAVQALAGWFDAAFQMPDDAPAAPAGIRRLLPRLAGVSEGSVTCHLGLGGDPHGIEASTPAWAMVAGRGADGRLWWEPLGPDRDRAAVIAIDVADRRDARGGRFVDAA